MNLFSRTHACTRTHTHARTHTHTNINTYTRCEACTDLKKTAEAELQKQMDHLRLWSNSGDADKRKAHLRELFAAKYRDLATVAAQVSAALEK